jgi:hypothetical protein
MTAPQARAEFTRMLKERGHRMMGWLPMGKSNHKPEDVSGNFDNCCALCGMYAVVCVDSGGTALVGAHLHSDDNPQQRFPLYPIESCEDNGLQEQRLLPLCHVGLLGF